MDEESADESPETFAPEFPENRYIALEEVQKLLGLKEIEWYSLFRIFRKADDSCLEFHVGDLTIQFALRSGDEKKVHLSLEFQSDTVGRSITYEFGLNELEALAKRKQLEIESVGGS